MKKIKKVDLNKDVDFKKVNEKTKSFWAEFKAFAIKGNAIDLAIGMVIGSAFTSIVNSLVKDILVILMHDSGDLNKTYDVLEDTIKYLLKKDYEFKSLEEFFD